MNRLSQDDTSHLNYETRLTVRDAEGRSFKQNRTCTQRQEEQQQERQQEQQQHPQHSSPAIRNESILSSNLRAKLQGDVLVASGITFAFAPFIATIDKAIVQRAAGSHSVVQSSRESLRGMVRHPVAYVKSPAFLMVWGVYAMTYSAVNCLKTCAEHRDVFDGERRAGRFCRDGGDGAGLNLNNFVMTAAVNSSLQLMKDRYYASNFGIWNSTNKIPLRSYGMWALRDCTIIGSSFILPDILGKLLQEKMELDRATASRISQFTCPIAAQAVATPLQLLGLDFYNRTLPNLSYGNAVVERLRFQRAGFTSVVGARILKIVPAFSFCGIGNTHLREMWREGLLRREEMDHVSDGLVGGIGIINIGSGTIR